MFKGSEVNDKMQVASPLERGRLTGGGPLDLLVDRL